MHPDPTQYTMVHSVYPIVQQLISMLILLCNENQFDVKPHTNQIDPAQWLYWSKCLWL